MRSIERAPDAAAIVHAIVGLGRGLGMKVTAEGVETAEQQLFLRAAGVHSMQGYRFGRPGSPSLIAARGSRCPAAWRSIEGTPPRSRAELAVFSRRQFGAPPRCRRPAQSVRMRAL